MNTLTPSMSPGTIIWQLVRKDWHFVRGPMLAYIVLGLIAIAMLTIEQQTVFMVGAILLISVVAIVGIHLVFGTVISERKLRTLPLVMSLPLTYVQYSIAKLVANIGIFATVWATLLATALVVIAVRDNLPDGLIPFAVIVLTELFAAYVVILAVAMISESEAWSVVVMSILNIGISIFMISVANIPAIGPHIEGPVPVWNATTLGIIGIEILVIAGLIVLTLLMQSKKTDFL